MALIQAPVLRRLARTGVWVLLVLAVAGAGWQWLRPAGDAPAFASGNGRLEAVEIDIASKLPGRVSEVLVDEGDVVRAGDVLARMDTAVLQAQLAEAEAQLRRAQIGIETADSLLRQRQAEKRAAEATVAQRDAEREGAAKRLARSRDLAKRDALAQQQLDDHQSAFAAATAAVAAARAQVAAVEAAMGTARATVVDAAAAVQAAEATVRRIQADLDDAVLRAPRDGRVQYRVAQPGEVVGAGAALVNMVDLNDVYMTFFLGTEQAGRLALGAEARLVLDAVPQYAIPAQITYVADVAQFTPKSVETAEERRKLMFRVKASVAPGLVQKYLQQVKPGLPGVAWVRLDPQAPWPAELEQLLQ